MLGHPLRAYIARNFFPIFALVTILYAVSGEIALYFAIEGTNVTPLWPPSGIALAAVLLCGNAILPAIFLGSFLVNLVALGHIVPNEFNNVLIIMVASSIGIGAALQAVVGNLLISNFISQANIFATSASILKFLLFGMASGLVNSSIGPLSLCLGEIVPWESYFSVWKTWWIGDLTGITVITPLILAWLQQVTLRTTLSSVLEFGLICLLIVIAGFVNYWIFELHFTYLFIPWMIWATVRFKFHGATFTMLLTAFILTLETLYGRGPFSESPMEEAFMQLAIFIVVITTTLLLLASKLQKSELHWKNPG